MPAHVAQARFYADAACRGVAAPRACRYAAGERTPRRETRAAQHTLTPLPAAISIFSSSPLFHYYFIIFHFLHYHIISPLLHILILVFADFHAIFHFHFR
jgi:hypothetical protein